MGLARKPAIALVAAATLLLAVAGGALLLRSGSGGGEAFALEDQQPRTAGLYRYVETVPGLAATIPCYCGCGPLLGHTSLLDCFIRPDGKGYGSHASYCAICTDEAEQIMELEASGTAPKDIRVAIDGDFSRFGAPTDTP